MDFFCLHNESDLAPHIITENDTDWVVVLCKACDTFVGERIRLISLVDEAITRARRRRNDRAGLDPDLEL